MFNEYRRKDYVVPRSMKEAYGHDETYDPVLRCVSELWNINRPPSIAASLWHRLLRLCGKA